MPAHISITLINDGNIAQHSDEFLHDVAQIMLTLRSQYTEKSLMDTIKVQMQSGYQIAVLVADEKPVTLAGFILSYKLAWKKHIYLDDLVTDEKVRGRGYGQKMLNWLQEYAIEQGCEQLHLDSGVQRFLAHKLYLNQGFNIASHHFSQLLHGK
ncbi:GNAT family N-acetyltransferase [Thalassotalea litorea]|uniref:GNAT family N-acetyltransferase n=1 Tax=Thalassotalea litorea TaxID=2020715 RepID=A0A5R9IPL0_9GAMM|nr:GNAT family N-acetyltransferase [Thalassotalea litorea]TLU67484.1 GNAT family N-acetyltransferase [Thalassotalea litorea]